MWEKFLAIQSPGLGSTFALSAESYHAVTIMHKPGNLRSLPNQCFNSEFGAEFVAEIWTKFYHLYYTQGIGLPNDTSDSKFMDLSVLHTNRIKVACCSGLPQLINEA